MSWEAIVTEGQSFWYGGMQGRGCKVRTPTLKSVCEEEEWREIKFETYYLN